MRELLHFLALALGTALVLAGATRATKAAGIRGRIDLLVAVSTLAAAQIVITLLFAGIVLGELTIAAALATNAVVSGALLVAFRPARESSGLVPSLHALAAFARGHRVVATLATLAALAIAWRVLLALVIPPYAFDPLHYHLPTIIGWIQDHRISTSKLNSCCAYYPQDGEVLTTWTALLGGGVEYVQLVQIAFALVGAAALAGIARLAHMSRAGAVAAASLFLLTPVLLAQANTVDVDVTFTATAVASYYLVLRALAASGRRRWFLFATAGVSAGLCTGVKPTGSEFLATLALPLVVGALARRQWTWRETGLAAALFTVPVAVLGLGWYLHSWIETSSPYYPMVVKFGGHTIFHGTNNLAAAPPNIARYWTPLQPLVSWASDLHFWTRPGYTLGSLEGGGLGPVWSYFGVVCTILFAVYAWRRCRPVFWFFLVPSGLLFAFQPAHWYARYTIGVAAVGSVAVAWAMTGSWQPRKARLALSVATLVLAAAAGGMTTRLLIPTAGFKNLSMKAVLSDALHGRRTVGKVFGAGYEWIDQIHGQPVAVDPAGDHMFAPVAGRDFQNRLVPLPARADLTAWVKTHDVAYVVTFRGAHYDSYYDRQARANPTLFRPIGGKRLLGYRVVRRP